VVPYILAIFAAFTAFAVLSVWANERARGLAVVRFRIAVHQAEAERQQQLQQVIAAANQVHEQSSSKS
jgi:hypothetical protein